MSKLGFKNRQNRWRPEVFYDDLTIDDLFIDQWFGKFNPNNRFDVFVSDLINALHLRREEYTEKVWHYLGQLNAGDHYFVPVLACPDDLDLTCCVVVADQLVSENSIKWLRYGFLLGDLDKQNSDNIEWFSNVPALEFEKQNFIDTFQFFATKINQEAEIYGEKLNLKIPTDPPKEDWELIFDSWYD